MSRSLLISMHMEKCGGTSVEALLRQQYAQAFQLYDPGSPQVPQQFKPVAGVRCLHGHMYYGLHEMFPDRNCNYITLLRDPVARFISNYQHIRSYQHPLHELVSSAEGLQAFCANTRARHYRNLFVRRLAGVENEPGEQDLDKAEARLRQFALVGRLEQFGGFVRAAKQRLGWQAALEVPHKNAGINTALINSISLQELDLINSVNALDIELMARVEDILV